MRKVCMLGLCVLVFLPFSSHSRDNRGGPALQNEAQLLAATEDAGKPWCRQACFDSETEAHLQAGRLFLAVALASQREVSWRVYLLEDGTYTFSRPSAGERGATQSRMPPLDSDYEYLSSGHIHWDEMTQFSAQDWVWVTGNNRTLYLVTREGALRKATPKRTRRGVSQGSLFVRAARPFQGRFVARINP